MAKRLVIILIPYLDHPDAFHLSKPVARFHNLRETFRETY